MASGSSNTFIGGQNTWSVGCIDAAAGSNNRFINPNFGLSSNIIVSSVGVSVEGQGKSYGTAYSPPTSFKNDRAGTDTYNVIDCVGGSRAGFVFADNGTAKAMVDKDSGGNLVFRTSTNGGVSWDDAGYINPTGQWIVNNANIQKLGLAKSPVARQTVTGSRGGNTALAGVLNALAQYGLITGSTTA